MPPADGSVEKTTEELAAAEEAKQAEMVENLQDAQLSESIVGLFDGMGTPMNAFEITMQPEVEGVEVGSIRGAVKRRRRHLRSWDLCPPSPVKEEDQSCYQVVDDRWPTSSASQSATQSTPRTWAAWLDPGLPSAAVTVRERLCEDKISEP